MYRHREMVDGVHARVSGTHATHMTPLRHRVPKTHRSRSASLHGSNALTGSSLLGDSPQALHYNAYFPLQPRRASPAARSVLRPPPLSHPPLPGRHVLYSVYSISLPWWTCALSRCVQYSHASRVEYHSQFANDHYSSYRANIHSLDLHRSLHHTL
jgi:hypothetical protein